MGVYVIGIRLHSTTCKGAILINNFLYFSRSELSSQPIYIRGDMFNIPSSESLGYVHVAPRSIKDSPPSHKGWWKPGKPGDNVGNAWALCRPLSGQAVPHLGTSVHLHASVTHVLSPSVASFLPAGHSRCEFLIPTSILANPRGSLGRPKFSKGLPCALQKAAYSMALRPVAADPPTAVELGLQPHLSLLETGSTGLHSSWLPCKPG